MPALNANVRAFYKISISEYLHMYFILNITVEMLYKTNSANFILLNTKRSANLYLQLTDKQGRTERKGTRNSSLSFLPGQEVCSPRKRTGIT